jgi:hypothetical protein
MVFPHYCHSAASSVHGTRDDGVFASQNDVNADDVDLVKDENAFNNLIDAFFEVTKVHRGPSSTYATGSTGHEDTTVADCNRNSTGSSSPLHETDAVPRGQRPSCAPASLAT